MKKKPKTKSPGETHCLNCGTELTGPFCAQCGQKANVHKDTFWHMLVHFIGDYFHYNSKFSTTAKTLFTKPGLITLDYIQGKRARYLNPIQLYIFISTVFFLILFATQDSTPHKGSQRADTTKMLSTDSVSQQAQALPKKSTDSLPATKKKESNFRLNIEGPEGGTVAEYDSIQATLPSAERDHILIRPFYRKLIQLTNNYETDEEINHAFLNSFLRNLPKSLFLLLPFFGLLLMLFFRRQRYFYVDHLIFSIHVHCLLYTIFGILILLEMIVVNETIYSLFNSTALIWVGFYLLFALKRIYNESWFATIIKQFFLLCSYFICLIFVLAILLFFSILII